MPIYGPTDNPVPEGPLQRIFEFHGPDGNDNYAIAKFRIWRRLYSHNARVHNLADDAHVSVDPADLVTPDVVVQSLISYVNTFAWPVNPGTGSGPASPPFDVPPNLALIEPTTGDTNGMPSLPGVSEFGVDVPAFGAPGRYGTTQNQSAGFEPCLRLSSSPGGTPPSAGIVPAPPSEGGRTATWGSTEIKIQLHDGGLISATDPGPDGGVTLAETSVAFSGITYTNSNGRTFSAIQGAVRPRDWSAFTRQPLWSENITGAKGSNFGEVWILLQRQQ